MQGSKHGLFALAETVVEHEKPYSTREVRIGVERDDERTKLRPICGSRSNDVQRLDRGTVGGVSGPK